MNTTIIGSGVAAWTLVRELRKADPEAPEQQKFPRGYER